MPDIDFHSGETTGEAIALFIADYNRRISAGDRQAYRVVHGGTSGRGDAIRKAIRALLREFTGRLEFAAAGAAGLSDSFTTVYPKQALPCLEEYLADRIADFCVSPKPEERIYSEFVRFGDPAVRKALVAMRRDKRLLPVQKRRAKCWQSAGTKTPLDGS